MNTPPWLLNLLLRVFVRWPLGRIKTPQDLRARFEAYAKLTFQPPKGSTFSREHIRRTDGSLMRAVWASLGRSDRHSALLFLHGGAYLAGSPETHKHLGAALSASAGVKVLLPDYRLAPEHPFPAAVGDALDAYRYLLENHPPERIAVIGDSAGGGLAFALLLALQDAGLAAPAAVVAFSPFTNMTLQSPSFVRNARREVMLPPHRAREAISYYLQDHDPCDPLASPVFGEYRAPPPALILASTSELLTDNATEMAETLRAAGGDTQVELWPGLPHAWPIFIGKLRTADKAVTLAGEFIRRRLQHTG
ncbi:MAG: alpha/beta hydrolase fold domain-containing protein [Pseudomonadota bacterium]